MQALDAGPEFGPPEPPPDTDETPPTPGPRRPLSWGLAVYPYQRHSGLSWHHEYSTLHGDQAPKGKRLLGGGQSSMTLPSCLHVYHLGTSWPMPIPASAGIEISPCHQEAATMSGRHVSRWF